MTERIEFLIKSMNLSPSRFADEIDVQRSSLSHILSGRNKPSLDFIIKILSTFPQINPDWLLFDKGSMIRKSTDKEVELSQKPPQTDGEKPSENAISDLSKEFPEKYVEIQDEKSAPYGSKKPDKIILLYTDGTFKTYEQR